MTIAWTGTGGAFTILGSIFCFERSINGQRGAVNPTPSSLWGASGPQIRGASTAVANIIAAHATAQQPYYEGIRSVQNTYIAAQDATLNSLKSQCQSELIAIVNADNPQPDTSLATAMKEFIRQFNAASQKVQRCNVGQTVTAGSANVGNAIVLCSVTGRYGLPLEHVFAETLVAACAGDAAGNGTGATLGSEPITISAPAAATGAAGKLSQLWPGGSASSSLLNVIDPNTNAGANLLTNSNFEAFTVANIPDNWNILVGVAGTDVKKTVSTTYGALSGAALQFVGDGSTLSSVAQTFGAAAGSGTTATVKPATLYGCDLWVYAAATIAAGVLKIELVDGSNNVINDDAGTANTITQDLTALVATTWTNVGGFFRTPTNLPTTVKLRIRLSTAMTNAKTLNMDFGAMGLATQLYSAGGPYAIAFRASTDLIYKDTWNIAITNDQAGIFQTLFEENFDMSSLGYGPLASNTLLSGTITGATNANPIVVTSAGHGLTTGQLVTIAGVAGNTAANVGGSAVTVISSSTFSIAVAGNGAYTSGGTWTLTNGIPESLVA